MKTPLILILSILLAAPVTALAKRGQGKEVSTARYYTPTGQPLNMDRKLGPEGELVPPRNIAGIDTTWLAAYYFDTPLIAPDAQGWTSHDATSQVHHFHVADATELDGGKYGLLLPLDGSQSMWCGIAAGDPAYCDYAALPGYGPLWNESLVSDFVHGTSALLSYRIYYDTESGYDYVFVDYETGDGNWIASTVDLDGAYDGFGDTRDTFVTTMSDSIRFRFRFTSDAAWDNADGLHPGDGAFVVDSLTVLSNVEGFYEDFEADMVGDTDSDYWHPEVTPAYGNYAGLYSGLEVVQQDRCGWSWTHLWSFFSGSTDNYACGGFPIQPVVPFGNIRGQYIDNSVRSPLIPLIGTGSRLVLQFDVYIDLPLDNLVFYAYEVRSLSADSCLTAWQPTSRLLGGGDFDDWITETIAIERWIDTSASDIQVALSVVDMCDAWCGIMGTGACHSHAPLFDNVKVGRVQTTGPQWTVWDGHLFQDTFAEDGTTTGTARADMAMDILPYNNPLILPGDSIVVTVVDIEEGIATDPFLGGPAVYCYVSVLPQSRGLGWGDIDSPRFPYSSQFVDIEGILWMEFRMDSVYTDWTQTWTVPNLFCFDLNDQVFVAGDTIQFFFGAENNVGVRTYWSQFTGTVHSLDDATRDPMEFQVLPGGGWLNGGDILYIDDFDARGAQPYFEWAFRSMDIAEQVDRYDVRAPSSNIGNGIDTKAPLTLIFPYYRTIIYNSGDLSSGTLGDGGVTAAGSGPGKSDECMFFHNFLENHPNDAGIYLSGDDVAEDLAGLIGGGALGLKTNITYNLTSPDHVAAGFPITPLVVGVAPLFFHVTDPDTMYAYGGCPVINDFDVMEPTGASVVGMTYEGTGISTDGAVIARQFTNQYSSTVGVVLSGFSYHYIRDDRLTDVMDRDDHLWDILNYLGSPAPPPYFAPPAALKNELFQNYRNPFNPTTVIKFTIKERSRVTLKVYNVNGQLVRRLVDEVLSPDSVEPVEWDGRNDNGMLVASGVYFYQLVARDFQATKKMVLIK